MDSDADSREIVFIGESKFNCKDSHVNYVDNYNTDEFGYTCKICLITYCDSLMYIEEDKCQKEPSEKNNLINEVKTIECDNLSLHSIDSHLNSPLPSPSSSLSTIDENSVSSPHSDSELFGVDNRLRKSSLDIQDICDYVNNMPVMASNEKLSPSVFEEVTTSQKEENFSIVQKSCEPSSNSLYKCNVCGNIFQLIEDYKCHSHLHLNKLHNVNKDVQTKSDDADGNIKSILKNDKDLRFNGSEESCTCPSDLSVCPPQEISKNSSSTSEMSTPSPPVVEKDSVMDTIESVIKSFKVQPSSKGEHYTPKRPKGRPRKNTLPLNLSGKHTAQFTNKAKRIVKEVKKDLVPLPKVCDWFTNCYPFRDPYYPQIDDSVLVFVSEYIKYEKCVTKESSVLMKQEMEPEISQLHQFNAIVREIKFEYRNLDGSKYVILITVESEHGHKVKLLWCSYPKPEYIVLKQYNCSGEWLVGDRFRMLVNQAWWPGYITKFSPENPHSLLHCFEVKFDIGDTECLSPWDLFKENTSRKPKRTNAGVPLYIDELPLLLYTPDADEWPARGRSDECNRVLKGIKTILSLNVGELFLDLNSNTRRYSSVHDLDLQVIVGRLEHSFYRRLNAVLFDVRLVKQTVFLCDFDKESKRKAEIVLEVLEQFIQNTECNDILQIISKSLPPNDLIIQRNNSVDRMKKARTRCVSEIRNISPPLTRSSSKRDIKSEYACIWRDECISLIDKVCKEPFATPFIEPVSLVEFPDYRDFIEDPICLKTIRNRLKYKFYSSPDDVKQDFWLLISNSRHYNPGTKTPMYYLTTQLKNFLNVEMTKIVDEFLATQRLEKRVKRK